MTIGKGVIFNPNLGSHLDNYKWFAYGKGIQHINTPNNIWTSTDLSNEIVNDVKIDKNITPILVIACTNNGLYKTNNGSDYINLFSGMFTNTIILQSTQSYMVSGKDKGKAVILTSNNATNWNSVDYGSKNIFSFNRIFYFQFSGRDIVLACSRII